MVDIGNFSSTSFENFDINLVQKEVDGGSVSVDQIVEAIGKTPNASSIVISGLKQDTFEYFIELYGKQFESISFWKNKLVEDLSPLSKLNGIKFINYFFCLNNFFSKIFHVANYDFGSISWTKHEFFRNFFS